MRGIVSRKKNLDFKRLRGEDNGTSEREQSGFTWPQLGIPRRQGDLLTHTHFLPYPTVGASRPVLRAGGFVRSSHRSAPHSVLLGNQADALKMD